MRFFARGMVKNEITAMSKLRLRGFEIHKSYLSRAGQRDLIDALRPVLKAAPLFSPTIPGGSKMSVRMTSAGAFGWYADTEGYRYVAQHPRGMGWPEIP